MGLNLGSLGLSGIPGLDESYLPRWIGYGFASLLLLNHFTATDITSAQLVSVTKPFVLILYFYHIICLFIEKILLGFWM